MGSIREGFLFVQVEILTGLRDLFLPEFLAKGLHFSCDIDPNLPQYLLLDRIRLRQILLNLIGNALKFTEHGGVTVTVQCEPHAISDERNASTPVVTLLINVADTGIGIPAERQRMIFEAFRQHEERANRKYGGTGIGLTLVQRLIELMAGSLNVESEVGQGSLFRIRLPNIQAASGAQNSPVDSHESLAPQQPAQCPSFTEHISPEAATRLPEAVRHLEEHSLPQWQASHGLIIIGVVADFGRSLQEVADTFSLPGARHTVKDSANMPASIMLSHLKHYSTRFRPYWKI